MNFMKFRYFYFIFSLSFIIPGLISLLLYGVKPSIDFTGGTLLELKESGTHATSLNQSDFQTALGSSYQIVSTQHTTADQYILRGEPITNEQKDQVLTVLNTKLGPTQEVRFETVGPTLGKELIQKTIIAGLLATAVIILYVWRQFKSLKYGVAAVVAMLHDAIILIGAFSILGKIGNVEVDVLFVTALLTILSFSVHDTIIVFDRIRENVKRHRRATYTQVIDASVLETLGRSINNSMTIIIMLLALSFLGGQTIHWFSIALLIGAVTGTYSSTFTAAPLLIVWDEVAQKIKMRRRKSAPIRAAV
ncbi:protein translocase subunit SecF [soil metagenome]